MKENMLKNIDGKKVRRQYFTYPMLICLLTPVYSTYMMLVLFAASDDFEFRNFFSDVICAPSNWQFLILFVVFAVLYVLNTLYFGRIICVLTEDGICCKDGFVKWEQIKGIKYVAELPSRYYHPGRVCRAILHTWGDDAVLLQAPYSIVREIKKTHPTIEIKLSNGSKWMIGITVALLMIVPFVVPLFA